MVHIVRKKKGDKIYLYLRQNHRVEGRSKQKWVVYLGPEHDDEKIKNKLSQVKTPQTIEAFNFVFPAILLGIAKKLELVNIINNNTNKRNQGISVGEYMLIAILNRCIKPTSKNQLQTWFDNSYLKDEFPQLLENLNSNAFSNHFKYLDIVSIDKIESDIQKKLTSEFDVDMTNLFYDPTNFYTFINPDANQLLPKHGHSKEGRKTLNIVNFSLFCSDDGGVPIMHKTYPGNIVDVTHFKTEFPRFISKMEELGIDVEKVILIFDKGNISDELFEELQRSKIKFICTIRPSTQKQLHHLQGDDFEIFTLPNKKKVGAKEFANKINNRVYRIIVSYEPARNKWYGTNLMEKLEIDIAKIDEWFSDRLNKKMWRKKNKVEVKLLDLIKKKHLPYIDYLIEGKDGSLKLTYGLNQIEIDRYFKTLGKSYLLTNLDDNERPQDIIWRYRQQYIVERAFKYIKNNNFLSIRPMFHYNDDSIRGHVFSCVLGLTLLSLLHRDVQVKFPEMSMASMVEELKNSQIIRVTTGNQIIDKIVPAHANSGKLLNFLNYKKYLS